MKGNTISEFINDLYSCGGPEKEFTFRGKRYFLETTTKDGTDLLELYVVTLHFRTHIQSEPYIGKYR